MQVADAVKAFVAVFPAEFPDKTMVATLLLTTRFRRPLAVWAGVAAAFAVHVAVAVTAGRLLSLLPERPVELVVAGIFAVGAVLLVREGAEREDGEVDPTATATGFWAVWGASFGLVFLAEWGDLTQLATASLAASTGDPLGVAVGALAALWLIAALATLAGSALVRVLPVRTIRLVAAAVFALLAVVTLVQAIGA